MKIFKWLILVLIVGSAGFLAWHFLSPYSKTDPLEAIPYNAVFIAETDNLFDAWERLTTNTAWSKLHNQPIFAGLDKGVTMLDTIIRSNRQLSEFIGHRRVFVSMHPAGSNKYDFLYIIDLRRISKILKVKDLVGSFSTSTLRITKLKSDNNDLFQIEMKKNGQKFYCIFNNNLFIGSFSKSVVESSMLQSEEGAFVTDASFRTITDKTGGSGIFRLYIHFAMVDNYFRSMLLRLDDNTKNLLASLRYTGLTFDIDRHGNISCNGYTMVNDTVSSSLRAVINSGMGNSSAEEILPPSFASSVSLCFNRFTDYFDNMQESLHETPYAYNNYQKEIEAVENYLGISIRKNFLDWIGEEVTLAQMTPMGLGKNNEFAVLLKTRNTAEAKQNLSLISKRIKNRTPVKIEDIDYEGHTIYYMSVKGFFRMILGKYFQKLESPYYTIIGGYVVFSNHPQVLKSIIDAQVNETYAEKESLFSDFYASFGRRSNAMLLVNTGNYLNTLRYELRPQTLQQMEQNRSNLLSYPYAGFQLSKDGEFFRTLFYATFRNQNDEVAATETDTAADSSSAGDSLVNIGEWIRVADSYVPADVKLPLFTTRYPDGKTQVEFEVRDGFRHGNYREYYANGEIKIKGEYRNDKKNGTWRFYSPQGKLIAKREFKNGEHAN